MKKLFTFLSVIALTLCGVLPANAQDTWNNYLINETFDGMVNIPTPFTVPTTGVIGRSGAIAAANNVLTFSGASSSGSRGVDLKFTSTGTRTLVYLEFDLKVTSSTINYRNTYGLYLLGSNSTNITASSGAYADVILGLFLCGSDGKFHYWNKDIVGPIPAGSAEGTIQPAYTTGQYPAFYRAGTSMAATDSMNLSTQLDVTHTLGMWYHVSAALDFTNKKVAALTITEKDNPTNTQTITDMPFVSNTVTDLSILGMLNNRSSNQGNASAVNLNSSIDNFQLYEKVASLGKADVTIQYQDLDGSQIKESRVIAQQEVGLKYILSDDNKATFTRDGNYYAYSAAATGSDTVVVAPGGSTIIAKFKKTAVTAGTYIWKGDASNVWNELDENFSTDGTNRLAYQNFNGIELSDATSQYKSITLPKNVNLGTNNLTITTPGYSLSGLGVISGTGALVVNKSASINVYNTLEQGVELNADTLEVKHANAAISYLVENGTAINVNAPSFSTPIKSFGGTFAIIPTAQIAQTATITGVDLLKYILVTKGNVTTAVVNRLPILNNVYSGKIDVSTQLTDTTYFTSTLLDYSTNKLHLGDHVRLIYQVAPVDAKTDETATSITFGELSGTESSSLAGAYLRRINYKVGSLNTDAIFAGTISPANNTIISIYKQGTGLWALTGQSPLFKGNLYANEGELKVDGTLGMNKSIETVTVAATGKLSGKGTFAAITSNVYGKLAGSPSFEGVLNLQAGSETDIVVDGSTCDLITVGEDLQYGGKLVVTSKNNPPAGTYKIIQAASYLESSPELGFDEVVLPSANWTFKWDTGELVYVGGDASGINNSENNKEVKSVEYFTVSGTKALKDQKGFLIKVTKFTDGSSSTTKAINK